MRRINEEGDCINISAVVPLDENSLLESARRATGLSDFGDDDWREPFPDLRQLAGARSRFPICWSVCRTRSEILYLLEARLKIEDTYKRHPEIEREQITQPIIIVGQGRSGTSYLHNILGANPEYGALTYWEGISLPAAGKGGLQNGPTHRESTQIDHAVQSGDPDHDIDA